MDLDALLKVGDPGDDYEHGRPGQRQSPETAPCLNLTTFGAASRNLVSC
jgi:hypothetical protein